MGALNIARGLLEEALAPHFKGKNKAERLEKALNDVMESISHLLTTSEDAKKNKLGVTVMTHDASAFKRPGSTPRSL